MSSAKRRAPDGDVAGKSRKKKRVFTDEQVELAHIFEGLADERADTRLNAAEKLVQKAQAHIDAIDGSPWKLLEEQEKIFVRLIKGLCSNRKAARPGFFPPLAMLFSLALDSSRATPDYGRNETKFARKRNELVRAAIDLIEAHTKPEQGVSKQEKRDYLLGRVFGYSALIESRAFIMDPASELNFSRLAEAVCQMAAAEPWLREECGHLLFKCIELFRTAGPQGDCAVARWTQEMLQHLKSAGLAKTPEGIAVWVKAATVFDAWKHFPKRIWRNNDPFDPSELPKTFKILRENAAVVDDGDEPVTARSGGRQQRPNFAFHALLEMLVSRSLEEQRRAESKGKSYAGPELLRQFWNEVFDCGFFAPNASHEKKQLGFLAFDDAAALLERVGWAAWYGIIFSPNFTTCLINQAAQKDRQLHRVAHRTLAKLCDASRPGRDTGNALVFLISSNGSIHFDQLTGSRTVQRLLTESKGPAAEAVVRKYRELLLATPSGTDNVKAYRQAIADQLLTLVRTKDIGPPSADDAAWVHRALRLLAEAAYFAPALGNAATPPSPPFDDATVPIFHARLASCLAKLSSATTAETDSWPSAVVRHLSKQHTHLRVFQNADENIQRQISAAEDAWRALKTPKSAALKPIQTGMRTLLASTLLEAYHQDTDAISLVGDLVQMQQDLEGNQNPDEVVGAIVDIIMDFASRQSTLHRKLAAQTFSSFVHHLKAAHLGVLFDVLVQRENLAGQQALFDPKPADAPSPPSASLPDAIVEVDSDVDVESDVEMDSDDEADSDPETDSHSSSSSTTLESSPLSDPDIPDAELAAFNAALARTLRTNPTAASSSSASDSDMSDNAMLALEPALAQAFRAHAAATSETSKKQQAKDARHNVVALKNRVLDLLELFARARGAEPLALQALLPLLRAMRCTNERQVAGHACATLQALVEAAKKARGRVDAAAVPQAGELVALVREIHDEALRFASKAHAASCSRASLHVCRVLVEAHGRAQLDVLDGVYAETNGRRRAEASKLPASFGAEWWEWSASFGKEEK